MQTHMPHMTEQLRVAGIIAIIRAQSADRLLAVAEAILAGGVRAIEVTLTTPHALDIVSQVAEQASGAILVGAGTVLDPESARTAILAGAQFIVSPTIKTSTVDLCRRYGIPMLAGAFTPTEILTAWEAGADMVKVFPAQVGGPSYIAAIRGPLPQIPLCPTGGVDETTIGAFFRAGVAAVGVGSALISQDVLDSGDLAVLTERARRLVAAMEQARGQ